MFFGERGLGLCDRPSASISGGVMCGRVVPPETASSFREDVDELED